LTQIRLWCGTQGHTIVAEYVDHESGRKADREQFNLLFTDAQQGEFDLVVFWALDRFSREGMQPTIEYLQRLASYGVAFNSYTETLLGSENEIGRDILLAVMASLAKQEAIRISDRTKAGLARARAKGKRLGRPAIDLQMQRVISIRVGQIG